MTLVLGSLVMELCLTIIGIVKKEISLLSKGGQQFRKCVEITDVSCPGTYAYNI